MERLGLQRKQVNVWQLFTCFFISNVSQYGCIDIVTYTYKVLYTMRMQCCVILNVLSIVTWFVCTTSLCQFQVKSGDIYRALHYNSQREKVFGSPLSWHGEVSAHIFINVLDIAYCGEEWSATPVSKEFDDDGAFIVGYAVVVRYDVIGCYAVIVRCAVIVEYAVIAWHDVTVWHPVKICCTVWLWL